MLVKFCAWGSFQAFSHLIFKHRLDSFLWHGLHHFDIFDGINFFRCGHHIKGNDQFSLAANAVIGDDQHILTVQGYCFFGGAAGVSGKNAFEFHGCLYSSVEVY